MSLGFSSSAQTSRTRWCRTVAQMYRSGVDYDRIAQAVQAMSCPVLANGNVSSASKAQEILQHTSARGLMIGRGAIRNPWLFRQIREMQRGEAITLPTGAAAAFDWA